MVLFLQIGCIVKDSAGKEKILGKGQISETSAGVAVKCDSDKTGNLLSRQLSGKWY